MSMKLPEFDRLNSIKFGNEPPKTSGEIAKKGDADLQFPGKIVKKSANALQNKPASTLELEAKLGSILS